MNSSINYGHKEDSNLTEMNIKFKSDRLLSASSTLNGKECETPTTASQGKSQTINESESGLLSASKASLTTRKNSTHSASFKLDNKSVMREARNILQRTRRVQTCSIPRSNHSDGFAQSAQDRVIENSKGLFSI